VRYDRGVIESFVDLTYRGLSLGRRVRLSQVRPSTGYLELPAPMPVGAQIAIAAEDGVAFEAIVTAIHEQIAGSDRTPGMIVAPALGHAAATAWWTARVTLPDDEVLRRLPVTAGGRTRPPTVRPRSHDDPHEARTIVMPMHELEAIAAQARTDGEHEVVDDGNRTTIMDSIDPATLGIDLGGAAAVPEPAADSGGASGDDADREDAGGEGDGDGVGGDDADAAEAVQPGDTLADHPPVQPSGGGRRKRKLRR
jgi:hypothetical protein